MSVSNFGVATHETQPEMLAQPVYTDLDERIRTSLNGVIKVQAQQRRRQNSESTPSKKRSVPKKAKAKRVNKTIAPSSYSYWPLPPARLIARHSQQLSSQIAPVSNTSTSAGLQQARARSMSGGLRFYIQKKKLQELPNASERDTSSFRLFCSSVSRHASNSTVISFLQERRLQAALTSQTVNVACTANSLVLDAI